MAICKFLAVMRNKRAIEWTDIKELSPLQFMPYVAKQFKNITGKDLQGLSDFKGWIGLGGYYHWKLAQLGQLQACPRLQGQPVPKGLVARPSRRPHLQRSTKLGPRQLEPPEGIRMEANRPQTRVERHPPQARVERHPTRARVERHPPRARVERHPPPVRAVNWPLQAEVRSGPPQGAQLIHPQRGKEWATVPETIGTKGPSGGLKGERLSPKGLPIQSGLHRQDGRPSAKFTTAWTVKTHPHAILPLRLCRSTIQESILGHCRPGPARYSV